MVHFPTTRSSSFYRHQTDADRADAATPRMARWVRQPYHIHETPSMDGKTFQVILDVSDQKTVQTVAAVGNGKIQPVNRLSAFGKSLAVAPLNGVAHLLSAVGVGSTVPVSPANLKLSADEAEIRNRMALPVISESDIKNEVKKFGENFANFVPMRLISSLFCESGEKENVFLIMIGKAKSKEDLKDAFFLYLDQANLFFLTRWIAKISYFLLLPFCHKVVQDTTWSMFNNLELMLTTIKKKRFNSLISEGLAESNQLFVSWINALESVAKRGEVGELKLVEEALSKELFQDQYYNDKPYKEFYKEVTTNLVDKYFEGLFLGKLLYDKLTQIAVPEPDNLFLFSLAKGANILINIVLFPIAIVLRALLLLPDYLFNLLMKVTLKKSMVNNDILENGVQKVLETIGTNKGLSVPVLNVLNLSLEEIYLEVRDGGAAPVKEGKLQDSLSINNQQALQRNVELVLRAIDLYSAKTVKDLRNELKEGERPRSRITEKFKAEVSKGIEELIILLYTLIQDPKYIKEKCYYLLKGVNDSIGLAQNDEEDDVQFVEQERQFFILIKAIVTTSINNAISGIVNLPRRSAARNFTANLAYAELSPTVEKMVTMASSPSFLKFNLIFGLNQFLKMHTT